MRKGRKIVTGAGIFSFIFFVSFIFFKENSRRPVEFSLNGETDDYIRFTAISVGDKDQSSAVLSIVPARAVICANTQIAFNPTNGSRNVIAPRKLNHVFGMQFDDSLDVEVRFHDKQDIILYCNTYHDPLKSLDSLPIHLRYNLSFVFANPAPDSLVWSLKYKGNNYKWYVFGYAPKERFVPQESPEEWQVFGYFNTDSLWKVEGETDLLDLTCMPAEDTESPYGDRDTRLLTGRFVLLPRLNIRTAHDPYHYATAISSIQLGSFKGALYYEGEKKDLFNARLNIRQEKFGILHAIPNKGKLEVTVNGTSDNLELNGEAMFETTGSRFFKTNPFLMSIAVSLITALIISILITKGKSLGNWVFPKRQPYK